MTATTETVATVRPTPRTRVLNAIETTFAFLTVLVIGSAIGVAGYFFSRAVAYAAHGGEFLPLLAVIGTASVLFVGWRIVSPARGRD